MPSGQIHDRVTWLCFPWVTLGAMLVSRQWGLGLLAGAGFLFGGLMFGPDLDVRSRQTRRWGWFSWIWYPYRKWLRHRSWLSHGPVAGTVLRLLYFGFWVALAALLVVEISNHLGYTAITWRELGQLSGYYFWHYRYPWLVLVLGIEAGAMSHSFSDWTVSAWKRRQSPIRSRQKPRRRSKS